MARKKSIKVDYKGVQARFENNELVGIIETIDKNTGEIFTDEVNITNDTRVLLASLSDEEKISINIKKYREPKPRGKVLTFKYKCNCGKEIKSKSDKLNITCNECSNKFILNQEEN